MSWAVDMASAALGAAERSAKKQGLLYNGDSALAKVRADIAKAANGDKIIDIVVIGSSSVVGYGSNGGLEAGNINNNSGWLTKGFVGRLRTMFATKYGDVGRGFVPHNNIHFYPKWTGTWSSLADYGIIGAGARKSSVAGNTTDIRFNGKELYLVVVSGSNGSGFTVAVDGSAPQSFTSEGENIGAKIIKVASGLADGSHTAVVTVGAATAPKGVSIIGHFEGKETLAGVRVHSMGVSGSRTAQALGENFLTAEIDVHKPSLTVICFSSNDYNAQTPLSEFKAQTRTLIERGLRFGNVLLFPAGIRSTQHPIPVEKYIDVYRELAEEMGVAFYDTHARWRSDFAYAKNTLGVIASDDIHMNDYGHHDLAEALYNILINY